MASEEILSDFYSKVYRKKSRPHYIKNPDKIILNPWTNAQYSYISQYFNFDLAKLIIDVGPGYGFLLREIKMRHPHVRLVAIDPDATSLKYLNDYDIETKSMFFEKDGNTYFYEEKVDLIISSHSLEHMTNPKYFFKTSKETLSETGGIFLEVPNCEFNSSGYMPRPYDSPHLLFFSKQFLKRLFHDLSFEIINISTAGRSMTAEIQLMERQFGYTRNKVLRKKKYIYNRLKEKMPQQFKNAIKYLLNINKNTIFEYYQYGGNRWTIRGFLRPKK